MRSLEHGGDGGDGCWGLWMLRSALGVLWVYREPPHKPAPLSLYCMLQPTRSSRTPRSARCTTATARRG